MAETVDPERFAALERVVRAITRFQRWREWAVECVLAPRGVRLRHPLDPDIPGNTRAEAEALLRAMDALWPPCPANPARGDS